MSPSILVTLVATLSIAAAVADDSHSMNTEPTYVSIRENILIPKCLKCHEGADAAHGLDFSTYPLLMSANHHGKTVIFPGDPKKSEFYDAVKKGKMPKKAQKLPKEEIEAIFSWIESGAKEFENSPQ